MATSKGSRFDFDKLEVIKQRKELEERRKALLEQGPPKQTFWYPGCGKHLLAGFVVVIAIAYTTFANYPAPPLSPILFQWQSMGINATKFQHNGYNIFYVDKINENLTTEENDLTLLYIHGFPTSSFDLHMIFANLTRNFRRIVAPDLIGFGFSDKPRFYTYTLMDQADLVVELVEMLKLKKVHILTHDYGNTVGQELMARKELLNFEISSMCMLNGGVFPSLHRPVLMQRVLRMPILGTIVGKLSNYYFFSLTFQKIFGPNTQPSWDTLSDSWKLIRLQDGYRVLGPILSYIDERFANEERWVSAIRNPPVPFHFIYGPMDPVNPRPVFEQMFHKLVRDSSKSLTVLEDIGHYPQLEAPDEVARAYLDFLLREKALNQIL